TAPGSTACGANTELDSRSPTALDEEPGAGEPLKGTVGSTDPCGFLKGFPKGGDRSGGAPGAIGLPMASPVPARRPVTAVAGLPAYPGTSSAVEGPRRVSISATMELVTSGLRRSARSRPSTCPWR